MSKVVITITDEDDEKMGITVEFDPVASVEFASHRAASIALVHLSERLGFNLEDAIPTRQESDDAN